MEILEAKNLVDWEALSLLGMGVGALAGMAYGAYAFVLSKGWIKPQKKRAKKVAPKAAGPVDHEDWVKGTSYDEFRKRASAKAAKK